MYTKRFLYIDLILHNTVYVKAPTCHLVVWYFKPDMSLDLARLLILSLTQVRATHGFTERRRKYGDRPTQADQYGQELLLGIQERHGYNGNP